LLAGAVLLAAAGCGRVDAVRPSAPASVPLANQDAVVEQARSIMTQTLVSLRALDSFAAWRISRAADSKLRSPAELEWDPPSASAWAVVDQLADLRNRAQTLFQSVAGATDDPSNWRTRRQLAEVLHNVVDAVDAQAAYRAALDHLSGPDGEASAVMNLLDRAESLWDNAARPLDLSRVETVAGA
jgi:hypothetical protein